MPPDIVIFYVVFLLQDFHTSRIHIRGWETRQRGNPSDEFPVLVWIRDEKVLWLTDMNSH